MNLMLTIGTAMLGFTFAYALGVLAAMRIRHAALISRRLAPIPRSHRRPRLIDTGPRFVGV